MWTADDEVKLLLRVTKDYIKSESHLKAPNAADVIVFESLCFQVSTLAPYVCVFSCIQQRFRLDAFSVKRLSVFERISVDGRPKRIKMRFQTKMHTSVDEA